MKFIHTSQGILVLASLGGILLSLSWPSGGFAPLIFISWIPLLMIEDLFYRKQVKYKDGFLFFCVYFSFFIFNLLTTWWVKYASLFGAVAAIVFNTLFMAIVFQLFHSTRKKTRGRISYVALIAYWIAFEHLHMDWDLSWPWLTMGNVFAGWVKLIQWYEFTGVLGGSIWVLLVNILCYQFLFSSAPGSEKKFDHKQLIAIAALILVPLTYSVLRYETYTETSHPVKVAVIQPNIDPYNEKFSGMSSEAQLTRILRLSTSVCDSSTDYVVAPETALPDGIWEEELDVHPQTLRLKQFLNNYPHLSMVIGLASNKLYPDSTKRSSTARKFTQSPGYYDSYNTAMQLERNGNIQLYHKSKLVPGVEKMPFPALFSHLSNFAIDLGGITGSLGMQDEPSVFTSHGKTTVAPVICYESIYGDYLTQYIRKGASLIFIITNDGWWGDTPGYRQHLKYATLRAVECRRSIARSANTGISCFINQRGDLLETTTWWTPAAIKSELNANDELTLYARYGDYLGTIATFISGIFLLLVLFSLIRKNHL